MRLGGDDTLASATARLLRGRIQGPRLPDSGWGGNATVAFQNKDVAGRALLFPQQQLIGPLLTMWLMIIAEQPST